MQEFNRHNTLELGPENDKDGNIEFKLKLVNVPDWRLDHLTTQMQFRLLEGNGECFYEIGVEDNGHCLGITDDELQETFSTLAVMAKRLKCVSTVIFTRQGELGMVGEVMIRELPSKLNTIELRVATVGQEGSGKSTLISVLVNGKLDNGNGRARIDVFRHKHEITKGNTSSIATELIGFNESSEMVNLMNFQPEWPEIVRDSCKVVMFIDLAGHEKFLRTTIHGISSLQPDYACVAIAADIGAERITREHLGVCITSKVPVFIVITKIDLVSSERISQVIDDVGEVMHKAGFDVFVVDSMSDVLDGVKLFSSKKVSIFKCSLVSGEGLSLINPFLNLLPKNKHWIRALKQHSRFAIDSIYSVSGVGTVVSGLVLGGSVIAGDTLLLGPDPSGDFSPVKISSIHHLRLNVHRAIAGQVASFALKKITQTMPLRRGMALVASNSDPSACFRFDAEIRIVHHPTSISVNYQAVLHIYTIRQTARIVDIHDADSLVNKDKALVTFEFISHPEFVYPGSRFVLREDRTRGLGRVVKIIPL